MKYDIKVYTIMECGQRTDAYGNPHQEDCIYPAMGQVNEADDRLFVVCDGMGGHEAGEVASATVCEAMSRSILADTRMAGGAFTPDMLKKAVNEALDLLDERDTGGVRKMGTTMAMLMLHTGGATIAHIGDSRVYHIRPGRDGCSTRILHRTRDHSLVERLIQAGELTEEQARHSRQRNIITRAMQPAMESRPRADVYDTADIQPGDYFYLCSDGMLEQMDDAEICQIFSADGGDDPHKVATLTEATADNHDNHTAFIVHVLGVDSPEAQPVHEVEPTPSGSGEQGVSVALIAVIILAAILLLVFWFLF